MAAPLKQPTCKHCKHSLYSPYFQCGWCAAYQIEGTTQKVKGVIQLLSGGYMGVNVIHPTAVLVPGKTTTAELAALTYPTFARPCPLTPRHGFVDSRVVKTPEELQKVLDETLAADPQGEVMLMPYMESLYNAVWVPSLLTVGKGNDGATVGKDVLTFPLSGQVPSTIQGMLPNAGIDPKTQDPYIEAVYDGRCHANLTQLRAGPKLDGGQLDYIPTSTMVKSIITVDIGMDLLKWEELIQLNQSTPGVVIHHPGGSPTDHFSVHARTFGIPVCITFKPEVGMKLDPIPTPTLDPQKVLEGLVVGDRLPLREMDDAGAVNFLLQALHNSGSLGGDYSWYVGVGAAVMIRFGSVALRGEARHIKSGNGMKNRESVYHAALPHTLQYHRASLPALVNILRYGVFQGSVGGIKWAQCGQATAKLIDAVGMLAKDPTTETVGHLMRAYNFAVNQAHNGGWWLNKFISGSAFNEIQRGSLQYALQLGPILWPINKVRADLTPTVVKQTQQRWAKWQPIDLSPTTPVEAHIEVSPGIGGLGLKINNRLLKNKHRILVVPIVDLVTLIKTVVKGKMYVEVTPEGMQVVLYPPMEDPIVVWKEKPIDAKH